MSLHKSLKTNTNKYTRSVRKRYERLRSLLLKEKYDKEHIKIYELPKEKIVKLKIKKEKKEETSTESVVPEANNKAKKKSKDVGKIK